MESSSRRSASSLPRLFGSSKCRSMTSTVLRSVKRFFSCASAGHVPKYLGYYHQLCDKLILWHRRIQALLFPCLKNDCTAHVRAHQSAQPSTDGACARPSAPRTRPALPS
eukprot:6214017-Pleurochrysis_carterae.AAC.1